MLLEFQERMIMVNGRRVVEFWEESGLCIGNTYFKHKHTRVAGVEMVWKLKV